MPDFDEVSLGLASPDQIRKRSAGEVTSPKTTRPLPCCTEAACCGKDTFEQVLELARRYR
jgi:hypothetical protein